MHKPTSAVSLKSQFLRQIAGVAGLFLLGIVLTLGYSHHARDAQETAVLARETGMTRNNLVRRLDYYRALIANLARDPELQDLMTLGSEDEQQAWATARRALIPDLLGLALVAPAGRVLGDVTTLRVGAQCQADLAHPGQALLIHREHAGLEHLDFVAPIRDVGGAELGQVFLSVRLGQLERVVTDSARPGAAIRLTDGSGQTVVAHGQIAGARRSQQTAVPGTGWTLTVSIPQQGLTMGEGVVIFAGVFTLLGVLTVLAWGMLRVRQRTLADLAAIHANLAALARGTPRVAVSPRYAEFVGAFADIDAVAAELDSQRAALARLSLTDTLTGLPNRRALEAEFPVRQAQLERHGDRYALVLLDVDHFKQVNDTLGHLAGDQVLQALARALLALTRRTDFCVRLAGDEFVVVLNRPDAIDAAVWHARLSERFRAEAQGMPLPAGVGLSAGLTWIMADAGETLDSALARADAALYRAKQQGRGRLAVDAAG